MATISGDWNAVEIVSHETRHHSVVATTNPRVPAGLRFPDLTAGDIAIVPANQASWDDLQAVEPRSAYTDLPWQRTKLSVRGEDPADQTVWAVTCFATAPTIAGMTEVLGASLRRVVMRIDFVPIGRPPDPLPSTKPQRRDP
jgi:hypothetical protein